MDWATPRVGDLGARGHAGARELIEHVEQQPANVLDVGGLVHERPSDDIDVRGHGVQRHGGFEAADLGVLRSRRARCPPCPAVAASAPTRAAACSVTANTSTSVGASTFNRWT